jgi:hypothetical protein
MAGVTKELPSFSPHIGGYEVAQGVVAPQELKFREGVAFFEQPPFTWLFIELLNTSVSIRCIEGDRVVERVYTLYDLFSNELEELSDSQLGKIIWLVAKYSTSLEDARYGISNGVYQIYNSGYKINAGNIVTQMEKIFDEGLNSDLLSRKDRLGKVVLLALFSEVLRELNRYPYLVLYIQQILTGYKAFEYDGKPKTPIKGEFRLPSYATFALNKGQVTTGNGRWAGLANELPSGVAALPIGTNPTDARVDLVILRSVLREIV